MIAISLPKSAIGSASTKAPSMPIKQRLSYRQSGERGDRLRCCEAPALPAEEPGARSEEHSGDRRGLGHGVEGSGEVALEAGGSAGNGAGRQGGVVVLGELHQVVEIGVAVV